MSVSPTPFIPNDLSRFTPRPPLFFWKRALPGGGSLSGLLFLAAWLLFQAGTAVAWASHLRHLAGSSALPTYWGDFITSRDLWEFLHHGGLGTHPLGPWTVGILLLALAALLGFGWRMQAEVAEVRPGLRPWFQGLAEAVLLALPPLLLLRLLIHATLRGLASTGIQSLEWLHLVGGPLLDLILGGCFMAQWWLCRLDLADIQETSPWFSTWKRHLLHSLLRVWQHPLHWLALTGAGAVFRAGLTLLTLWWGWRSGGATALRVLRLAFLLGAATLINAWTIGWVMRIAAHFWRHDLRVREEVHRLQHPAEPEEALQS